MTMSLCNSNDSEVMLSHTVVDDLTVLRFFPMHMH